MVFFQVFSSITDTYSKHLEIKLQITILVFVALQTVKKYTLNIFHRLDFEVVSVFLRSLILHILFPDLLHEIPFYKLEVKCEHITVLGFYLFV